MATYLGSVAGSGLPLVTRAQWWQSLRPGDLVFCWGRGLISGAIEAFTGGPSHVLKVWLPFPTGPWLTLEAEEPQGVRYGPFADYMKYPGDLVLARRPLTLAQVEAELALGATLLDYKYDAVEFASLVGRRFTDRFPLVQPAKELYCSGLQQAVAAASVPFAAPDVPWATPEQLYTDPSVTALCALLEGAS